MPGLRNEPTVQPMNSSELIALSMFSFCARRLLPVSPRAVAAIFNMVICGSLADPIFSSKTFVSCCQVVSTYPAGAGLRGNE